MSDLTDNLKLFKWNTTDETDLEQEFDIDKAMNDNWDKLDDFAERVNDAVIEIQDDIEEIQNKNTEQDETINTINESISSIQAKDEAQDTEIDKQSDLIQKLKDNCINVTTEEATQLQVKDASTLPARLEVRGNHSQETREGYNVLQNKLTSNTINGVTFTINEDKSVTLNGTATNNIITNLITGKYDDNNATNPLIIPENITNYRLSGCPSGGSWSTYKLDIYAEDNELIATDLGEGANIQKESDTILNLLRVRIIVYAGAVLNNVTFYPMIIHGTENKPYEQYGASPSINYPSSVRTVGDNVNIFPDDLYNYFSSNQNAIKELNGKEFKITTIANRYSGIYLNSNNDFYKDLTNKIKEKIITYSFDVKADSDIQLLFGTTGYETIRNVNNNWQRLQVTYEKKEPGIYFYNSSATVTTFYIRNIKLIFGEGDNLYSPYGQGSVEVTKSNNYSNFSHLANGQSSGTYNGLTFEMLNKFSCKISGKPVSSELRFGNNYNSTTILVKLEKNKKYKIKNSLNSTSEITLVNSKNNTYRMIYLANKTEITLQEEEDGISSVRIYVDVNKTYDNEIVDCVIYTQEDDDFIPKETEYTLLIQKPMLKGDYFDLERGKEVHKWIERELTGTENITLTDTVNGIAQFTFSQFYDGDYDTESVNINALSNCYKGVPYQSSWLKDNSIALVGGYTARIMTSEYSTVEEFKQMLAGKYAEGNPVRIYYKLIKPKELDLTEEQKSVLQQLSELPLFKGTNNIITAESLALLQMSYIADTQSYIDSKLNNINQQILELAGGN